MELLLTIMGIVFALALLFEKLTNFVRQLKESGSAKLWKGFTATVSVVPLNKRSEDCAANTSPLNDKHE